MLKTRLLALVAAFLVGFAPMIALAAPATIPVVIGPGGIPLRVTPVICVDQTGAYLACGGGGGGGSLSATAVANCANSISTGSGQAVIVNTKNALCIVNVDPTTGLPLDPAAPLNCGPTSTFVQCPTKAGQATLDAAGSPIYPQAGTANRTLTATNLSANTNTTICPTATNPVVTEVYFTTAGVGVGVNGQTLTTATPGTSTTASPDFAIGTAGTLYTFPVGPSNAITAYGAAGVVRCIQTLRQ